MRYNITINNVKSKEWLLDIKQAYLFAWFYELPSWADKVIIEGDIYYFASKTKAVEELPILTDKPDTMYRYYRQVEDAGLVKIKKIDNKDYIALTAKGKTWNLQPSEQSDKNPSNLGQTSEISSDKNPTYNYTIHDNYNKDKEENESFQDSTLFPSEEVSPSKSLKISSKKEKEAAAEKIDFDALLAYFNKVSGRSCTVVSPKAKKNYAQRIKDGYTKADIKNAIDNAFKDEFQRKENNFKYTTTEFISRAEKFELYASMPVVVEKVKNQSGWVNP